MHPAISMHGDSTERAGRMHVGSSRTAALKQQASRGAAGRQGSNRRQSAASNVAVSRGRSDPQQADKRLSVGYVLSIRN